MNTKINSMYNSKHRYPSKNYLYSLARVVLVFPAFSISEKPIALKWPRKLLEVLLQSQLASFSFFRPFAFQVVYAYE